MRTVADDGGLKRHNGATLSYGGSYIGSNPQRGVLSERERDDGREAEKSHHR